MPDIASLQFNIDSSQAQRAIAVLETLKASSIAVTTAATQQNNQQVQLTAGYAQQRDALDRLASTTATYDGTLTGLITRLNALRGAVETSRSGFLSYTTTLNQASQAALAFNATVDGLDRYASKVRELNITVRDTATAFQTITAAQQNVTAAGNAARQALEQMGVSLKGISPTDPGAVLERVATQLRTFRGTQGTLETAQQIFGPSFDAQALQRLERQPYIPYHEQQATRIQTDTSAQIDRTRFANQRMADENQRIDDRLSDLRSRFTQDPTRAGRLGVNIIGGATRLFGQTREQELAELERIEKLPPAQRQQYQLFGEDIREGAQTGSAAQWLRNLTSGTFSASQGNIRERFEQERRTQGFFPAAGTEISRTVQNFLNQYTPQTADTRPLTPQELYREQVASGQVLAQSGDTGFAQRVAARASYTSLVAGDRSQDPNLITPGAPLVTRPPFVASLPTWAGGAAPPLGPTGDRRQRYIQVYGEEEGNRRYEAEVSTGALRIRRADAPEQAIADQTRQAQTLMAIPWQNRPEAQARFQALAQLPGGEAALAGFQPGQTTIGDIRNAPGIAARQNAAIGASFQQDVGGQLQRSSEETQRQIDTQERLTAALKDGRGAAEDASRALSAYNAAKIAGATDVDANVQAAEALALALRQRVTQATAQTEEIKRQNVFTKERLDQARQFSQFDPITRAAMSGTLDIEQQIRQGQSQGTLPQTGQDPGFIGPLDPRAAATVDARRAALQEQARTAAQTGVQDTTNLFKSQIEDSQTVLSIMNQQNVSLQEANAQLELQKKTREDIATAAQTGNAADLQAARQRATDAETARQGAVAGATRTGGLEEGRVAVQAGERAATTALGAPGTQVQNAQVTPLLQRAIENGVLPGYTLEGALKAAENGTLPDQATQQAYNLILLGGNQQTEAGVVTSTRLLGAQRGDQDLRNAIRGRQGPGAAARIPVTQQVTDSRTQDLERQQQIQAATLAQQGQAADVSFTQTTATREALERARAAGLPARQAPGAAAVLGIRQQVEAGTAAYDPTGDTTHQRTAEALASAIAKQTEATAQASLAARTQIADQVELNEALKQGGIAVKDQAIDTQTAAEIQVQESLKTLAATQKEKDAIDALIARLREKAVLQKQAVVAQAGGEVTAETTAQANQDEIQRALNARGIFSNAADQQKTRETATLDQHLRLTGQTDTPEGQSARDQLAAHQTLEDNTREMGNLREAAQSAQSAIENTMDSIIVRGERGRWAFASLAQSLADVILKAAVYKPLENLISGQATSAGNWLGGLLGISGAGAAGAAGATGAIGGSAALGGASGSLALLSAGDMFTSSDLSSYSGQVVSRPTLFRFAAGASVGQMGEAGPEAIMPLQRGADGRLGVAGGGGTGTTVHINTPITVNGPAGGSAGGGGMDQATMKSLQRQLDQTVRTAVRGIIVDERRPGGNLYS